MGLHKCSPNHPQKKRRQLWNPKLPKRFRALGLRGLGFRGLGFRGLGCRV